MLRPAPQKRLLWSLFLFPRVSLTAVWTAVASTSSAGMPRLRPAPQIVEAHRFSMCLCYLKPTKFIPPPAGVRFDVSIYCHRGLHPWLWYAPPTGVCFMCWFIVTGVGTLSYGMHPLRGCGLTCRFFVTVCCLITHDVGGII